MRYIRGPIDFTEVEQTNCLPVPLAPFIEQKTEERVSYFEKKHWLGKTDFAGFENY